jgi:hypothetical protein
MRVAQRMNPAITPRAKMKKAQEDLLKSRMASSNLSLNG